MEQEGPQNSDFSFKRKLAPKNFLSAEIYRSGLKVSSWLIDLLTLESIGIAGKRRPLAIRNAYNGASKV